MIVKLMSKGGILWAIVLTVILSALPMSSYAKGYRSVVVSMTDCTTTRVELAADMAMRFTQESLEFVSSGQTTVTLDKQKVASLSFSEISGISNVVSDAGRFGFSGDLLRITGLADGSAVALFDATGRCVSREVANNGNYELHLSSLPAGVYIVNVNGVSYKIKVK